MCTCSLLISFQVYLEWNTMRVKSLLIVDRFNIQWTVEHSSGSTGWVCFFLLRKSMCHFMKHFTVSLSITYTASDYICYALIILAVAISLSALCQNTKYNAIALSHTHYVQSIRRNLKAMPRNSHWQKWFGSSIV